MDRRHELNKREMVLTTVMILTTVIIASHLFDNGNVVVWNHFYIYTYAFFTGNVIFQQGRETEKLPPITKYIYIYMK